MPLDLSPKHFDRDWGLGSIAVVLSVIVHALLLLWFWITGFQSMAIPAHRTAIPIQLKRLEVPLPTLKIVSDPSPAAAVIPRTLEAPVQLPLERDTVEQTLQSHQPKLTLPSPPQVRVAESPQFAPSAAGQSTPFSPSDQASIEAEIAKFQTGVPSLGAPIQSQTNLTSNAQGIGNTPADGGKTGMTSSGIPELPILPSNVPVKPPPSFDQLGAEFRDPNAGLNTRLPQPVLIRLPSDILFDFDVAVLKPEAFQLLQQALPLMTRFPVANLTVEGHTDTFGEDRYNQKLSEDRARSVEVWLRDRLPKSYTLQSRGYGKSRPIANPRGTISEQARNRRVEILIQGLQP